MRMKTGWIAPHQIDPAADKMLAGTPRLEVMPIASLVIHERHDEQRTSPLMARIQKSGVLRNPPVVVPLPDGSQRYMVLDGANRITTLRKMGYPHAVVQVVSPDDPELKLYNWNHVVWGLDPPELISIIGNLNDIELVSGEEERPDLWGDCGLAIIQIPRGDRFTICTQEEQLVSRVELLNKIVDCYKDRARLDRTNEWSVVRLTALYPDLCGLVIFPHFEIQQVLKLAGEGCLLPAGITRFTISPRALHLNYPLEAMAADQPLEEKNSDLQRFIQERMAQKGVRYYAEATYLFDE